MSTVATDKVVSFHYTLTDDDGEEIDSSTGDEPMMYLHGADNIVPGLERALVGKSVGDKLKVQVEPKDGYGERDEQAVHRVSRSQFPKEMPIQPGMQIGAQDPEGGHPIPAWITEVKGDKVTIDFNHPLAGVRLHFNVEITAIRDASAEELEHGHPHGPDGHHHHLPGRASPPSPLPIFVGRGRQRGQTLDSAQLSLLPHLAPALPASPPRPRRWGGGWGERLTGCRSAGFSAAEAR